MELFKLHVENLGRIKQADLSIRPLTVFVGPNNTNKTWTAYALYGLAKWLSWYSAQLRPGVEAPLLSEPKLDVGVDAIVEKAVKERMEVIPGTDENALVVAEVGRQGMLDQLTYPVHIRLSPANLSRLMAVSEERFEQSRVSLEFDEDHLSSARLDTISFRFNAPSPPACSAAVTRKRHGTPLSGTTHYRVDETAKGRFERSVLRMGIEFVLLGRFEHVVVLPAERKGLTVVGDALSEQEIRDLLIAPLIDFMSFLRNAAHMLQRGEHVQRIPDAVEHLEKTLLAGSLKIEGAGASSALLFDFDKGDPLRIRAASSLVRALAGLDLYLRYVAEPGDLLIIDEPEMNAHPEAQLMIAELLGILVNKGINVVITTHSPYIVDHINNLVEAAHLCEEKQKEIAGRFKLQTKDAFVPEEKVATYEFHDDGQVTDIFEREERLIQWDTFGKVSDEVSKLFNDILVAAHEE